MIKEQKKKLNYLLFIASATGVVFLAYRYLLLFVLPFLFAYWTAKLLIPAAGFLKRKLRLPLSLGSFAVLILFFSLLGAGVFFLLRTLLFQLEAFLKNIPVYQQFLITGLNSLCSGCDSFLNLSSGATYQLVSANLDSVAATLRNDIMPALTEQAWGMILKTAGIFGSLLFVFLSAQMMITDSGRIAKLYKASYLYEDIHAILVSLSNALSAYFRMQGIIISIIAALITAGLFLMGNEYALLLGIFIAVFDAFPILGSGLVFIPWALIRLISGDFFSAAILGTLYCLCQLIRQIMEPRLLGSRLGILPLFTLMSIYIGIKVYGIIGVFLGPLSMITIQAVLSIYGQRRET